MYNPPLYIMMLLSIFLYFSLKRYQPDLVPVMPFVDSWRSARGIFRLFSWVEFAVLAGSDLLCSASGNGEVRVCSCFVTLNCHCQSLRWAASIFQLSLLLRWLMSSPYSQTDRSWRELRVFSSSHIRGSSPWGICVKAIAMSLYLVMTVLLSFLKLMQNALGAVLPLMCTLVIKVSADVSQSHGITLHTLQKR